MSLMKLHVLLFLIVSSLFLSACGSGSESQLPEALSDVIAPQVVVFDPENDSVDVEIDTILSVTFSELIDEDTARDGGIGLFAGDFEDDGEGGIRPREFDLVFKNVPSTEVNLVNGNTQDSEATQVFIVPPNGRFALDSEYTLRIYSTITDLADDPNTSDKNEANLHGDVDSIVFKTEEGRWKSEAELLELDRSDSFDPKVVANTNGDVWVLWRQVDSDTGKTRVKVAQYLPSENEDEGGWANSTFDEVENVTTIGSEFVDSVPESSAFAHQIELNEDGHAVASWYQAEDGDAFSAVWVSRYDGEWSAAENVTAATQGSNSAIDPQVGIDKDGNVMVVWKQFDGAEYRLQSKYYQATTETWTDTVNLFEGQAGDANQHRVKVLSDGTFMAAWSKEIGAVSQLYTSEFTDASTWSAPERQDIGSDDIGEIQMAFDTNNDGFLVWTQFESGTASLWRRRFVGLEWNEAELVEFDDRGDVTDIVVDGSPAGLFSIAWIQDESDQKVLKAESFVPGSGGWQAAENLSEGNYSNIALQHDFEGNASLIAVSGDPRGSIIAHRYIKKRGWSEAEETIESLNGTSGEPALASMFTDGRMVALWSQYEEDASVADSTRQDYELGFTFFSDFPDL